MHTATLFAAALLLGSSSVLASQDQALLDARIDEVLTSSSAFMSSHPDLRYRRMALDAYEQQRYRDAHGYFLRSARFADKLSQARIAEMLWFGEGVAQDRAAAYAWMDLAAERGQLPLVRRREQIWAQLDETERERALQAGVAIYAEYGDDVAKPRMEAELRRGLRNKTGARAGGMSGRLTVLSVEGKRLSNKEGDFFGTLAGTAFDGSNYYDPRLWRHEAYWEWKDRSTERLFRGDVQVGEMRQPES